MGFLYNDFLFFCYFSVFDLDAQKIIRFDYQCRNKRKTKFY